MNTGYDFSAGIGVKELELSNASVQRYGPSMRPLVRFCYASYILLGAFTWRSTGMVRILLPEELSRQCRVFNIYVFYGK